MGTRKLKCVLLSVKYWDLVFLFIPVLDLICYIDCLEHNFFHACHSVCNCFSCILDNCFHIWYLHFFMQGHSGGIKLVDLVTFSVPKTPILSPPTHFLENKDITAILLAVPPYSMLIAYIFFMLGVPAHCPENPLASTTVGTLMLLLLVLGPTLFRAYKQSSFRKCFLAWKETWKTC